MIDILGYSENEAEFTEIQEIPSKFPYTTMLQNSMYFILFYFIFKALLVVLSTKEYC